MVWVEMGLGRHTRTQSALYFSSSFFSIFDIEGLLINRYLLFKNNKLFTLIGFTVLKA